MGDTKTMEQEFQEFYAKVYGEIAAKRGYKISPETKSEMRRCFFVGAWVFKESCIANIENEQSVRALGDEVERVMDEMVVEAAQRMASSGGPVQ